MQQGNFPLPEDFESLCSKYNSNSTIHSNLNPNPDSYLWWNFAVTVVKRTHVNILEHILFQFSNSDWHSCQYSVKIGKQEIVIYGQCPFKLDTNLITNNNNNNLSKNKKAGVLCWQSNFSKSLLACRCRWFPNSLTFSPDTIFLPNYKETQAINMFQDIPLCLITNSDRLNETVNLGTTLPFQKLQYITVQPCLWSQLTRQKINNNTNNNNTTNKTCLSSSSSSNLTEPLWRFVCDPNLEIMHGLDHEWIEKCMQFLKYYELEQIKQQQQQKNNNNNNNNNNISGMWIGFLLDDINENINEQENIKYDTSLILEQAYFSFLFSRYNLGKSNHNNHKNNFLSKSSSLSQYQILELPRSTWLYINDIKDFQRIGLEWLTLYSSCNISTQPSKEIYWKRSNLSNTQSSLSLSSSSSSSFNNTILINSHNSFSNLSYYNNNTNNFSSSINRVLSSLPLISIIVILDDKHDNYYFDKIWQSMQTQTFQSWECLVVDNAISLKSDFEKQDDGIKWISYFSQQYDTRMQPLLAQFSKRKSTRYCRNIALKFVRAPFVVFWKPSSHSISKRLELQWCRFQETLSIGNKTSVIVGNSVHAFCGQFDPNHTLHKYDSISRHCVPILSDPLTAMYYVKNINHEPNTPFIFPDQLEQSNEREIDVNMLEIIKNTNRDISNIPSIICYDTEG